MKYLITGTAGFIGFHLAKRLLGDGHEIVGIDNLNGYYDVSLKEARLDLLGPHKNFTFIKMDISDRSAMGKLFAEYEFDKVFHLAAQAGVRYSIENPHVYIQSNVVGFMNILEGCRQQWANHKSPITNHLIYASSSSVYGSNTKLPFSTGDNVDHPISLYAATKKSNELMAHTYSHLYNIPTTGLRFFTVYGPWGRPDMAYFKFAKAISNGEPIDVYNEGNMKRDFTYIDDIIEGVVRVANKIPSQKLPLPLGERVGVRGESAPYALYNIGNSSPVNLMDFIRAIEFELDRKAKINYLPMQPGDVKETYADVSDLEKDVGYRPSTDVCEGVRKFVKWYREYFTQGKQIIAL